MAPIVQQYPKGRLDVHVRRVEGDTLILDRQGRLVHQLNQTASFIWDRCDGTSAVADIADQLAKAFDVDPRLAAQDVAALICQLQQLGLLEPREDGPCRRWPGGWRFAQEVRDV